MIPTRLFKEPLTSTQIWSLGMFTNSLRVLIAAVVVLVIAVLVVIYTLAI